MDEALFETTAGGGRQHKIPYAFQYIDAYSILKLAECLKTGADTYGVDNWRRISTREHVGRAIQHLYLFLYGDMTEAHLVNAFARSMMALANMHTEANNDKIMGVLENAHSTVPAQPREEWQQVLSSLYA